MPSTKHLQVLKEFLYPPSAPLMRFVLGTHYQGQTNKLFKNTLQSLQATRGLLSKV